MEKKAGLAKSQYGDEREWSRQGSSYVQRPGVGAYLEGLRKAGRQDSGGGQRMGGNERRVAARAQSR